MIAIPQPGNIFEIQVQLAKLQRESLRFTRHQVQFSKKINIAPERRFHSLGQGVGTCAARPRWSPGAVYDKAEGNKTQAAKLLGTVLHLHRGTPYIYQGEELGMTNVPFSSIEDFRDIESLNYYSQAVASGQDPADVLAALRLRSRDNGRTPMQWDDSPHAGFTVGEPWMPVNPNYDVINAEAELANPDSVLQHYRKLIALRHDLPVVAYGDFTMLLPQDPQIYAFTRRLEDIELLVLANFSHEIVEADLLNADDWAASEVLLTNYSRTDSEELLRLRPWEARVFRRTVNGATPRR